jgi:hypothetical protein
LVAALVESTFPLNPEHSKTVYAQKEEEEWLYHFPISGPFQWSSLAQEQDLSRSYPSYCFPHLIQFRRLGLCKEKCQQGRATYVDGAISRPWFHYLLGHLNSLRNASYMVPLTAEWKE